MSKKRIVAKLPLVGYRKWGFHELTLYETNGKIVGMAIDGFRIVGVEALGVDAKDFKMPRITVQFAAHIRKVLPAPYPEIGVTEGTKGEQPYLPDAKDLDIEKLREHAAAFDRPAAPRKKPGKRQK